jgi:hypothetical protein
MNSLYLSKKKMADAEDILNEIFAADDSEADFEGLGPEDLVEINPLTATRNICHVIFIGPPLLHAHMLFSYLVDFGEFPFMKEV